MYYDIWQTTELSFKENVYIPDKLMFHLAVYSKKKGVVYCSCLCIPIFRGHGNSSDTVNLDSLVIIHPIMPDPHALNWSNVSVGA